MINKVRGTRDLLDFWKYRNLFERLRKYFTDRGFTEINTPILEKRELFERAIGTETDVVQKEMFHIVEDDSACLRPEATAGTVRAFFENNVQERPWKVFIFGKMFRHERPQKGRYREFFQFSIERIGDDDPLYDAELVAMLDNFFAAELGLTGYALNVNFIGCAEDRKKYGETIRNFVRQNSERFCELCRRRAETNPLRVLDCKNDSCHAAISEIPDIDAFLCDTCRAEKKRFKRSLELLGVTQVRWNRKLVRGLDYYRGAVFEFVSLEEKSQNAFCGGGRYDLGWLFSERTDAPAVGAAIGVDRLILLMESEGKFTESESFRKDSVLIIPVSPEEESYATLILRRLLAEGLNVDLLPATKSLKSRLRRADRSRASHVMLIGSEEVEKNEVLIKNLSSHSERKISQEKLLFRPNSVYEV